MKFKRYDPWHKGRWPRLNDLRLEPPADPESRNASANSIENNIREIENAVKILEYLPFPEGNGIVFVCRDAEYDAVCSRIMRNFSGRGSGLFMTDLRAETLKRLQQTAPGSFVYRNPVCIGSSGGETCAAVIETLLDCGDADILICQNCFNLPGFDVSRLRSLAKKILTSCKPVIFFGSSGDRPPDAAFKNLITYPTVNHALCAARFLVEFRNNFEIKALEAALGTKFSNS